jgi:hypothetical protein
MREVFTIYDRILFRITKEVRKVLGTPLLILFTPSPLSTKENTTRGKVFSYLPIAAAILNGSAFFASILLNFTGISV